ncbi:MAG TPA: hypothetical protein VMS43_16120 [Allosphingosinicella sp.]|nr:hypothetical protein [Allosphingosinicella sp.]
MDLDPGGGFSDPDGRPVTDAETLAACQEAWDELHRRTARQSAAIQSWRLLGRDELRDASPDPAVAPRQDR